MELNVSTFNCPQCGAPLNNGIKECKYCGEVFATVASAPQPQSTPIPVVQTVYVQQPVPQPVQQQYLKPAKSKVTAGILALLLGGIGAHKFYLGKPGLGILYLIFCWAWIPSIVAFIEGIIYLSMDEKSFAEKYGGYVA